MTDLGFTNKELSDSSYYGCSPCCPSDEKDKAAWEAEVRYPTIDFNGKVADALGAEDLALDEVVEVTVRLRVKSLRSEGRVVDGQKKRDVSVCFEVLAASDLVSEGAGEQADEDEAESTTTPADESSALGAVLNQNA